MQKISALDRKTVWLWLVILITISFCWNERVNSIGIILLAVHFFWDKKWFQKIKSFRWNWINTTSIAFFLFHIIAFLWSSYKNEAGHSIETKLAFVILPFLFSLENYLTEKNTKQLFYAFSISCTLSFLYCLVYVAIKFGHLGLAPFFDRMIISSALMHPGYYANFFSVAFVANIIYFFETKKSNEKWIHSVFAILFFVVLCLLISKTAMIFVFFFAIYILWKMLKFVKRTIIRIGLYILILVTFTLLFTSIPMVKNRINETFQESKNPITNPQFSESTTSRKAAWALEWSLIKEKPIIGYGTGSANPLLLQKFKEKNYTDLIAYNMHTHNQLFHTWIDLGLVGLLLLFLLFIVFFIQFLKQKNEIGISILLLFFINLITDDMLEIQSGVVFFTFLLFILSFQKQKLKRFF